MYETIVCTVAVIIVRVLMCIGAVIHGLGVAGGNLCVWAALMVASGASALAPDNITVVKEKRDADS